MSAFDPKRTSRTAITTTARSVACLRAPDTVTEAAEIMRGLINRIVLTPKGEVLRAELHGDLAVLARFAQAEESRAEGDSALRLSVVAGVGFENFCPGCATMGFQGPWLASSPHPRKIQKGPLRRK
jgi:hypothetical protein